MGFSFEAVKCRHGSELQNVLYPTSHKYLINILINKEYYGKINSAVFFGGIKKYNFFLIYILNGRKYDG